MTDGPRAFQALGLQGQFIFIDPDTSTVIVKMSHFPPDDRTSDAEAAAFFKAASAWQPVPSAR
jgi:CubicO group peptidase (beta-lactamase class C family)